MDFSTITGTLSESQTALQAATAAKNKKAAAASESADQQDRFLKLLVAQMQNQDPMNPLDNAQVTSQMAQISTVTGIDKLNGTVAGLNTQFAQMQALQGASLVGRDVLVEGNRLQMVDGKALGAYQLDGKADKVKVEVLDASGAVVDTLQMGAQASGRQDLAWTPPSSAKADARYTFRVTASAAGTAVDATPLSRDKVQSVSLSGDSLTLQLQTGGATAYTSLKAVL
ncbi:flagellar hook assembly protein FlgD [Aquabacterium sp. J223]|uniref:flagellar hook assembly protein FlgD n=1 Tax=Aquabacterium sp. J223 TaxID=2898431 RepID=UPI0021AD9620|nr:flagellar hook capping FlgD N-terminal domain-containing protein [Aquabacterium sp. J223]UUX97551.1 flagellar hook assembly protein FlgD [Aquabacterium sp. J223]